MEGLELYQKGFGEPLKGNDKIRFVFSEIFPGSSGGWTGGGKEMVAFK